jgi:hypothetical protein
MYLVERAHIRFGKTPVFCLMDMAALSLEINQWGRESLHISPTSDQLQVAKGQTYLHWHYVPSWCAKRQIYLNLFLPHLFQFN